MVRGIEIPHMRYGDISEATSAVTLYAHVGSVRSIANGTKVYTDVGLTTPVGDSSGENYWWQDVDASTDPCDSLCYYGVGISSFKIWSNGGAGTIRNLAAEQNGGCWVP